MPYSFVTYRKINKYVSGLLFSHEVFLDILGEQIDLVYSCPTVLESGMFLRKRPVYSRLNTGVDESFDNLEGDTEQGDRSIAQRIPR